MRYAMMQALDTNEASLRFAARSYPQAFKRHGSCQFNCLVNKTSNFQ